MKYLFGVAAFVFSVLTALIMWDVLQPVDNLASHISFSLSVAFWALCWCSHLEDRIDRIK